MSTEGLGRGPLKSSKGGCRKAPIPPSKLGKGHQGQVGPRYGKGLPNRIHKRPLPEDETAPTTIRGGAHGANEGGAERATAKRGGRADGTGQGRFLLNPVPSAEKRRQTTPRNKPQSAKPVRSDVPLQDGRLADAKGPVKARRLAGKGGPKGCLFRDPYKSKTQEVSKVCSGQPDLPVQLSPLWPGSSTMGLHQDPQASSGYAAPDGGSSGLLHRRHTPAGGDPDSGRGAGKGAAIPVGMSWLYCAPRQINHDPGASDGVPGNNSRLHKDGTEVACQKIKRHPGGGPKTGPAEGNSCESSVPISWEDECSQPYHTTCPAILQEPTDGHDRGPKCQQSELRRRSDAVSGLPGRAKVVGLSPEPVEREEHAAEGSGLSDRIRCVTDRVGSSLQPPTDWRAMVKGGAEPAHKLPGVAGSNIGIKVIHKGTDGPVSTLEDGQYHGSGLCQQPGRHSLQGAGETVQGAVDMVSAEEYHYQGTTPPRSFEPSGRLGVSNHARPVGLEARLTSLSTNPSALGPIGGGFVCLQTDNTVPSLFQLAARSICGSNRCLPPSLDGAQGICKSTMEFGGTSGSTGPGSASLAGPSSTSVEDPALVPNSTGDAGRCPTPDSPTETSNKSLTDENPSASRLAHIREKCRDHKLSEKASSLILGSWREKTNKSYNSLFGRWHSWCSRRGADPFSGPVTDVANFLAELFTEGYKYNSLNAYRSAISSAHEKVEGYEVGHHPLITRLIKGVFNTRPPLPKYTSTWNVQTVLDHITSRGANNGLSLKELTLKTVMLLSLTRPSRSADLAQLEVGAMHPHPEGVSFTPTHLSKQSRQGRPLQDFFFPSFEQNPLLCPVATLQAYLERTKNCRGQVTKVLIGTIKPHKAVAPSTIARWLKTMLECAGIDTNIFSGHSIRGAASSMASKGGVTTGDILKAADWSSESVFQKFYHKSQQNPHFGRTVLSSAGEPSE